MVVRVLATDKKVRKCGVCRTFIAPQSARLQSFYYYPSTVRVSNLCAECGSYLLLHEIDRSQKMIERLVENGSATRKMATQSYLDRLSAEHATFQRA